MEPRVDAAVREQVVMAAPLDEPTLVEHEHDVRALCSREAVRDRHRRAAPSQALDRPRQAGLDRGVDS